MADLAHRFNFHEATDVTGPKHGLVRQECLSLARKLDTLLPEGREKALVLTKLEEAMFWANAAIARA